MTKRPSLAESMRQKLEPVPPARPAIVTEVSRATEPAPAIAYHAATRAGLKKVTAALDPAVHKRLRMLAVDLEKSGEDLLREAIDDLFAKYGK
ncbi:MAG: hypothetical protein JWM91_2776 [Rhodospirillales bacterium]|nr:hypothetical protein [Rhodospirillales bacterium]